MAVDLAASCDLSMMCQNFQHLRRRHSNAASGGCADIDRLESCARYSSSIAVFINRQLPFAPSALEFEKVVVIPSLRMFAPRPGRAQERRLRNAQTPQWETTIPNTFYSPASDLTYISEPGVVSNSPVSSRVLSPESIIGHPP